MNHRSVVLLVGVAATVLGFHPTPAAIAARDRLQEVLKQHPTAPGSPNKKAAKVGNKNARKKG